jgi:uncharacterized protein (TIGR02271 family)
MRTVIGLLDDTGELRATLHELKELGIPTDQISILSRDASVGKDMEGLLLKPVTVGGLGSVAAGGAMLALLTPSTAEANTEALVSALMKMGVPREEALAYVDGVKSGLTLEAAIVEDDEAGAALDVMQAHTHEVTAALGGTEATGTVEVKIPVIKEELRVGKREVPAGGVRISTHVIEKPVVEEIALRAERIFVERRPTDQPLEELGDAFKEKTIELTAVSEEPVVAKRARVVEEVVVRKETEARTETVHETVRKTDVAVRTIPPFEPSGYREHFQRLQAQLGGDLAFETYEPAYRFGHELRTTPRYEGRDWAPIEADVRSTWEKGRPGTWERFRDAIRHAWERATG